ncbi:hypothetical protein B0H67DRAFT_649809 [Lasiosphaeris hirsuta]|uniref:DUF6546 domain-containing protein n=1 Tax=Lasiosphaeris hirsuta TaxID=260670 RepID=A0AA40DMP2_9PEZI|nr:hypothetical protein B0H67DRAFT_649809 [Lasiosphaeris hirsuta]
MPKAEWGSLPRELHLRIWEAMLDDQDPPLQGIQGRPFRHGPEYPKAALLAAVSKSWQAFFETHNFRRLILVTSPHRSCVYKFSKYTSRVPRRRLMVEQILLRIELGEHCRPLDPDADPRGSDGLTEQTKFLLREIMHLLQVLCFWDLPAGDGPTMEIDLRYVAGEGPHSLLRFKCLSNNGGLRPARERTCSPAFLMAAQIGQGIPLLDEPELKTAEFPNAPVVKGLLMRSHTYSAVGPLAIGALIRSLPGLENIEIEVACGIKTYGREPKQIQVSMQALQVSGSAGLKRLSVFENWSLGHYLSTAKSIEFERAEREAGEWLARASRSLEHLSAAFVADAEDFFRDFLPGAVPRAVPGNGEATSDLWPHLESLALTAWVLRPPPWGDASATKAAGMLQAAARAALEMPRLRTMEIWNASTRNSACVFRYRRRGGPGGNDPTITMSSPDGSEWCHEFLQPQVIEAWDKVAQRHSGRCLKVDVPGLPPPSYRARRSEAREPPVNRYLELRDLILLYPVWPTRQCPRWQGHGIQQKMEEWDDRQSRHPDRWCDLDVDI